MAEDGAFQQWLGKFERLGATPGAAVSIMWLNSEIDIAEVLPTIHVPTLVVHRTDDVTVNIEGGHTLARLIPNAQILELPGRDHLPWVGENPEEILQGIELFLTGERSAPAMDRVLATVSFTDIVDSTARAEAAGDQVWHDLLDAHDKVVRQEPTPLRASQTRGSCCGSRVELLRRLNSGFLPACSRVGP